MTTITANLLIKFSIGNSLSEIWPNEVAMRPIITEHLAQLPDTSSWKNESFVTFKWLTSPLFQGYDGGMSGYQDRLVLTMSLPLFSGEAGHFLAAQEMMQ